MTALTTGTGVVDAVAVAIMETEVEVDVDGVFRSPGLAATSSVEVIGDVGVDETIVTGGDVVIGVVEPVTVAGELLIQSMSLVSLEASAALVALLALKTWTTLTTSTKLTALLVITLQ